MRDTSAFFVQLGLAIAVGLASACQSPGPAPTPGEQHPVVAPGEEPLETATLGDEEVVPVKPDPRSATPPPGRPCAWASVWKDPQAAHPLLAGVGGAPQPEKIDDAPVSIPVGDGSPVGEIVVEIVIAPDGRVAEASIVHAAEPRRPEAEKAILTAVRKWRYEKPTFDGTPVAICSAVVLQL